MNRTIKSVARLSLIGALFALLQTGATACGEDEPKMCTAMGCMNGATLDVSFGPASLESNQASTLEVCLNDDCVTGHLTEIRPTDDTGGGTLVTIKPSGEYPMVNAYLTGGPEEFRMHIEYVANAKDDLNDGDHYRFKLVGATGQVLFDVQQTATYEVLSPNGPQCDGEGGLCRNVSWEQ